MVNPGPSQPSRTEKLMSIAFTWITWMLCPKCHQPFPIRASLSKPVMTDNSYTCNNCETVCQVILHYWGEREGERTEQS